MRGRDLLKGCELKDIFAWRGLLDFYGHGKISVCRKRADDLKYMSVKYSLDYQPWY